jgi:hypothetical protein
LFLLGENSVIAAVKLLAHCGQQVGAGDGFAEQDSIGNLRGLIPQFALVQRGDEDGWARCRQDAEFFK